MDVTLLWQTEGGEGWAMAEGTVAISLVPLCRETRTLVPSFLPPFSHAHSMFICISTCVWCIYYLYTYLSSAFTKTSFLLLSAASVDHSYVRGVSSVRFHRQQKTLHPLWVPHFFFFFFHFFLFFHFFFFFFCLSYLLVQGFMRSHTCYVLLGKDFLQSVYINRMTTRRD